MKSSPEISRAAEILKRDGVIGLPTETVYGLAASISSESAIQRIFEIKERPFFDPLIVHISNIIQIEKIVAEWPKVAEILSNQFWPGPLTMVLRKYSALSPLITSGLETVGVRMPKHKMTLELIDLVGPLAAPSANKFGKTSPTSAEHVRREFINEDLFVLDGGPCEIGIESTVISVSESEIKILRPGMITEAMLAEAVKITKQPIKISYAESAASPGHLKNHYQPKIPLYIFEDSLSAEKISKEIQTRKWKELPLEKSPAIAARNLYHSMRALSEEGLDAMIVVRKPEHAGSDWIPIWDRLTRASSALTQTSPKLF
jgi:L-threonylcarbamoyladenylate synthase